MTVALLAGEGLALLTGPVRPGQTVAIDEVRLPGTTICCSAPKPRLKVGRPAHVDYRMFSSFEVDAGHEDIEIIFYDGPQNTPKTVLPVRTGYAA